MRRITTAHISSGDDEPASSVDDLHYRPEPLVLARLRDACCDPWPGFQPAMRRLVCDTLDAVADTLVRQEDDQIGPWAPGDLPEADEEGGTFEQAD